MNIILFLFASNSVDVFIHSMVFNKMTHNNSLWLSSSLLLLFFCAYDIFSILSLPSAHLFNWLIGSASLSLSLTWTDIYVSTLQYTKATLMSLQVLWCTQIHTCSKLWQQRYTLNVTIVVRNKKKKREIAST